MKCLILDYGGTFIKYSVMDEKRVRYESGEVPAPLSSAEEFKRVTKELFSRLGDQVEGAAISFPGFIDTDTSFLSGGGAYMTLYKTCLNEIFQECTQLPFLIENDGKCGALAEAWGGALDGAGSGIVIILGTGIAGGLIQDGRLYKGRHFTAGELSYLTLDWDMKTENIAQFRCSASALIAQVTLAKGQKLRNFAQLYEATGVSAGWKHGAPDPAFAKREIDGFTVFELLEAGDPDVTEIYDRFCQDVASMVRNLQCVYDPERIAIGGGISRQDRLVPDIERKLADNRNMLLGMLPKPELVRCRYQGDANQYGAMYNYLMKYHPDLI